MFDSFVVTLFGWVFVNILLFAPHLAMTMYLVFPEVRTETDLFVIIFTLSFRILHSLTVAIKHGYFTEEDMQKQRAGLWDLRSQARRQLLGGFSAMLDYPHMLAMEIDDSAARAEIQLDQSIFIADPKVVEILRKADETDVDEHWRPVHLRAERRFLQQFHYSSVPERKFDRPSAICSSFIAAEILKSAGSRNYADEPIIQGLPSMTLSRITLFSVLVQGCLPLLVRVYQGRTPFGSTPVQQFTNTIIFVSFIFYSFVGTSFINCAFTHRARKQETLLLLAEMTKKPGIKLSDVLQCQRHELEGDAEESPTSFLFLYLDKALYFFLICFFVS